MSSQEQPEDQLADDQSEAAEPATADTESTEDASAGSDGDAVAGPETDGDAAAESPPTDSAAPGDADLSAWPFCPAPGGTRVSG